LLLNTFLQATYHTAWSRRYQKCENSVWGPPFEWQWEGLPCLGDRVLPICNDASLSPPFRGWGSLQCMWVFYYVLHLHEDSLIRWYSFGCWHNPSKCAVLVHLQGRQ
jgi:hypothetical protein